MDRICRLLEEFSAAGETGDPLPEPARAELASFVPARWAEQASCVSADPDAWFPDVAWARPTPSVAGICGSCPVRTACLAAAILHDEHGIWGGTRRGQRLHARARLLAEDHVSSVLAELLAMPLPRYEYLVPDVVAEVVPIKSQSVQECRGNRSEEWRESA